MNEEANFVKFIRAKAKTNYHKCKKEVCWVCGSNLNLELHHNKPLASIVKEYLKQHNLKNPSNDNYLREQIIESCSREIYGTDNLITLCRQHHKALHNLFGRAYNIKVSEKVKNYLRKQKERLNG